MKTSGIYSRKNPNFATVQAATGETFAVVKGQKGLCVSGDTVQIQALKKPRSEDRLPECEIIQVLKRSASPLIVQAKKHRRWWAFVLPFHYGEEMIFWFHAPEGRMRSGGFWNVWLKGPLHRPDIARAEPIEKLSELTWQIQALLGESQVPLAFSDEVQSAANNLSFSDNTAPAKDITDMLVFTVDGEDAKDLDDAISLEKTNTGWRLGVHIADVTGYVAHGSPIDLEAQKRGTSIYLADRVVPMLPEKLSNHLCSLQAGTKKRCLTAWIDMDTESRVLSCSIERTIIFSRQRLTYNQVFAFFEKKDSPNNPCFSDIELGLTLTECEKLSEKLQKRRKKEGKIDFGFDEIKAWIDTHEHPHFAIRTRNEAHKMIEEFMVLANEQVALKFGKHLPFPFRVHEGIGDTDFSEAEIFARDIGLLKKHEKIRAQEFAVLVERAQQRKDGQAALKKLLRCMKKALYLPENRGHFGLGLSAYLHFTSPIRRYPDLLVHRAIGSWIDKNHKHLSWQQKNIKELSLSCSAAERRADELESRIASMVIADTHTVLVGKIVQGFVTGVSAIGIWIQLESGADGLLPFMNFSEYMGYDTERVIAFPESLRSIVFSCSISEISERKELSSVWYIGKSVSVLIEKVDKYWGKTIFRPAK